MVARTVSSGQYATEDNLAARQRLWQVSRFRPEFSLFSWVLGLLRLRGDERVLDVGCGNGAYLEHMTGVGLDSSIGMLHAARDRSHRPLLAGNAVTLPFFDGAFDVVLCAHVLYHVTERDVAISELRRVLSAPGTCVVVTNGEANHAELVRLVEDVVGHGWKWHRSSLAFSLENGAAQLRTAFSEVQRVDCPSSTVEIRKPEAVANYLTSVGDLYEAEVSSWTRWPAVVEECRRRVAAEVNALGYFGVSTSMGAFVCR
jgi:SAM-dependent methyltransferase